MTESQKHAARLREWIKGRHLLAAQYERSHLVEEANKLCEIIPSVEAGAAALESQGRWRLSSIGAQDYLIPCEHWNDWDYWRIARESGEYTAIAPEWAKPVRHNLVITGVELP